VHSDFPNALYIAIFVLTPWSKGLVEKLLVPHPVKKIPCTFETPDFIAMFSKALPGARSIHFTHLKSTIMTLHLRVGHPGRLFPSGFPPKTLFPICAT
jgi:hypothetical protein